MNHGHSQIVAIVSTAAITFAAAWLGGYILNSPAQLANANTELSTRILNLTSRFSTLCNDYGQTVSRLDQNLQAIGSALKVPIVVGRANSDPCK